MALADRVDELVRGLPRDWERVRLDLTLEDPAEADRAALILAPATPGRSGATFALFVHDEALGLSPTPALAHRVLGRLDDAGIRGRLRVAEHDRREEEPSALAAGGLDHGPLAASWDTLLRRLPPDWSDLYAEVELDSSDYLERGALLLAPVNPSRAPGPTAFRFRAANRKGYGVAAIMAHRAFERLDEEGLTGRVRVLRVLSDTKAPFSQGPVWREDGRAV